MRTTPAKLIISIITLLIIPLTVQADGDVIVLDLSASSVRIEVGDDIQSIVDANPPGTTYTIAEGIHRMQSIEPDDGDTFIGEYGAILNGARLLTEWHREGDRWYVEGQTQFGEELAAAACEPGYERCRRPEELFVDGERWHHVNHLDMVDGRNWFFDYDNDRIYIGENPGGRTVETSITQYAFHGRHGHTNNVTIRNLTIEKYSTPPQQGSIHAGHTTGWVIDNITVTHSNGAGVSLGNEMQMVNSRFFHNGQLGIHGHRVNNTLVENNEIAYNNGGGYLMMWEAGGLKIARSQNIILRNNYVHNNKGVALWADIDSVNIDFIGNYIVDNTRRGVYMEISYEATVRDNYLRHNGDYGQIYIFNSSDVEVFNNHIVVGTEHDNGAIHVHGSDRGSGEHGPRVARDNHIHNNIIVFDGDQGTAGMRGPGTSPSFWTSNRFNNNTYYVQDEDNRHWSWEIGAPLNWDDFRSVSGYESDGRLLTSEPPAFPTFPVPDGSDDSGSDDSGSDSGGSGGTDDGGTDDGGTDDGGTDDGGTDDGGSDDSPGDDSDSVEASAPTGLRVNINQGRPSVTFDDDPDAEWYHFWLGTSDYSSTIHMEWYPRSAANCDDGRCTLLLNGHPTNGSYVVFMQTWGEATGMSAWAGSDNFTINFDAPALNSDDLKTVTTDDGLNLTWNGSEGATWYQVWVGTPASDWATYHSQWYAATDLGCESATTCELPTSLTPPAGEYVWYVQAWGPGGTSEWAEGEPINR